MRFLKRLPLGAPYPEIARRLGEVCDRVGQRFGQRPEVFIDATGVGTPIVDILQEADGEACFVWAVYLTHGHRRVENLNERKVTLGKARLVSRLQALLQYERLHLPTKNAEAQALAQEMLNYEIRVNKNARERYGAFRLGTHDDLVTAIGLAVQKEPKSSVPAEGFGPETGTQ